MVLFFFLSRMEVEFCEDKCLADMANMLHIAFNLFGKKRFHSQFGKKPVPVYFRNQQTKLKGIMTGKSGATK